jgi:hypothetical protein
VRNAHWVMERIGKARPETGGDPGTDVQQLVDALLSLKCGKNLYVFGIVPAAIEADAKKQVIDACEQALREWRRAFTRTANRFGLWELSRASLTIGMPEFRLEKPFPLLCDPLGDASGLEPEWKSRLDRLKAAVARRTIPKLEGLGFDARRRMIKFGPPDRDSLYAQVLRFETYTRRAFPRDVAAWWWIADGMGVDGAWYFAPAKQWTLHGTIEGALIIGVGRYARGTLTLAPAPEPSSNAAQVADCDQNGQLFRRYPSFAALADLLLQA